MTEDEQPTRPSDEEADTEGKYDKYIDKVLDIIGIFI